MLLEDLAEEGGITDVLLEILSGTSLTGLLQLSLTTKSMYERVKKLTATDFFWQKWVLNSLFPHHHPELIEKIPDEKRWRYYVRLHGRFEASEVYWSGIGDANVLNDAKGSKAGILSRFYPVYSSPVPLTVVKQHHRLADLVALREGVLGFIAGKSILSGEWITFPEHAVKGETYVDFFISGNEQEIQICLLTKLGRVYRMYKNRKVRWEDVCPLADIEGLGNDDIIVQINERQFLDRWGQIYSYDGKKLISSPPDRPVARLGEDYLPMHPGLPPSPIYFEGKTAYLSISITNSLRNISLSDWKERSDNNLAIEKAKSVFELSAAVRGVSSLVHVSAAWTVGGKLFTYGDPHVSGNNRSSKLFAPAIGIPDFVVWAHVAESMPIVALALPRERDNALRKELEITDAYTLRSIMGLLMFDVTPKDVSKVREFLLRERPDDIRSLHFGIVTTFANVERLYTYPLKTLREALRDKKVPNFSLYTQGQAASKLALIYRDENLGEFRAKEGVPLSSAALQEETVIQLKKRAKEAGIKGYSKMKKGELIEVILNIK